MPLAKAAEDIDESIVGRDRRLSQTSRGSEGADETAEQEEARFNRLIQQRYAAAAETEAATTAGKAAVVSTVSPVKGAEIVNPMHG
jgi:hypothetical protein